MIVRVFLLGKVTRSSRGYRHESWCATVSVNGTRLLCWEGFGDTPAEAIANARREMSRRRHERAHPSSWHVGRRWRLWDVVTLARAAEHGKLLPCFACIHGRKFGHRCGKPGPFGRYDK